MAVDNSAMAVQFLTGMATVFLIHLAVSSGAGRSWAWAGRRAVAAPPGFGIFERGENVGASALR